MFGVSHPVQEPAFRLSSIVINKSKNWFSKSNWCIGDIGAVKYLGLRLYIAVVGMGFAALDLTSLFSINLITFPIWSVICR